MTLRVSALDKFKARYMACKLVLFLQMSNLEQGFNKSLLILDEALD